MAAASDSMQEQIAETNGGLGVMKFKILRAKRLAENIAPALNFVSQLENDAVGFAGQMMSTVVVPALRICNEVADMSSVCLVTPTDAELKAGK